MRNISTVSPMRRGSSVLRCFVLMSVMACASARGTDCRDHDDTTTSQPTTSSGPTTATTGSGTGASIDDAEVADLDRAAIAVLAEVYGQARRASWKREDGPGSIVFTLEYGLGQRHARANADALQAAMSRRGFTLDRVLADEAVTTVFASRGGFPVIFTLDVGSTSCIVTVDRAGP